jgi:hypothetical protein
MAAAHLITLDMAVIMLPIRPTPRKAILPAMVRLKGTAH